jgi:hypothetical protein
MIARYPHLLVLVLLMGACTSYKPVDEPNQILKNAISFWAYKQKHIRLYEDFQALDSQLKPITRETFLRTLSTGRYLPLRLENEDTTTLYQLLALPDRVDQDLKGLFHQ